MSNFERSMCTFDSIDLWFVLQDLTAEQFDVLPFGVIRFDGEMRVCAYNRYEQDAARLSPEKALGKHVFSELAQCMNNYLVAQKFDEAKAAELPLDLTIDYVLTWRMKPTPVKLRMLSQPAGEGGFIVLKRLTDLP